MAREMNDWERAELAKFNAAIEKTDAEWQERLTSKQKLWTTYSVELLQSVRAELVFWERRWELPVIDKIIKSKQEA